jgi:hypothetical protein
VRAIGRRLTALIGKQAASLQADEKVARHRVAAGLPRHNSNDFKTRWRCPDQIGTGSAAATPFFLNLLGGSGVIRKTLGRRIAGCTAAWVVS